ncbi:MAG: hypothetical protein E6J00_14200 [Chloroflexi bacterium]|nr:MAG: hypothetical protein E6J00_14200 [Chloroflexota bacterium]
MVVRLSSSPSTSSGSAKRLPASGNTALAASALIQAALGLEFVLSGLNKFADPAFIVDFRAYVTASPGAHRGLFAPLVQQLVLPHIGIAAQMTRFTELGLGLVLLAGAIEIARRRLGGSLGKLHGYEAAVALLSALAGAAAAGISFSIFMVNGGVFPTITPGRAFTSAIPVELLMVPLGIAIAWLETGRFLVLRAASRRS